MPVAGTTVGPLEEETRDRLKRLRDEEGYSNYNETLLALLDDTDA